MRLPLSSVAYTLLQLTQNRPQQEDSFRGPEPIRLSTAEQFLVSYLSEWSTDSARQSSFYFDEMMHTHSIRYFEVTHSPPTELLLSLDGIPVPRETVRLTNSQAYLNERRVSLALFGESRSRLPCFTIIYLADHIHHSFGPNDLITRGYFASIHLFINIITRAIDLSCEVWERVLTELDTELNITVRT